MLEPVFANFIHIFMGSWLRFCMAHTYICTSYRYLSYVCTSPSRFIYLTLRSLQVFCMWSALMAAGAKLFGRTSHPLFSCRTKTFHSFFSAFHVFIYFFFFFALCLQFCFALISFAFALLANSCWDFYDHCVAIFFYRLHKCSCKWDTKHLFAIMVDSKFSLQKHICTYIHTSVLIKTNRNEITIYCVSSLGFVNTFSYEY